MKTPSGDFYAHRNPDGSFRELDEQGRSLAADRRQKSKTTVKPGFGGEGDQKRRKKK